MTSPQKVLLALARNPRGIPFVSLGRLSRPLADLQSDLRLSQVAFLEIHSADRSVRILAPQELPVCRGYLLAQPQSPFVVGFSAHQHAALCTLDRHPSLFAAMEADEQLSTTVEHQPRFLHPTELCSRLLRTPYHGLSPGDYAHRLGEIDAILGSATTSQVAGSIRSFRASAAKYREAAPAGVPEGKFWTTDPDFSGEEETAMPREVLPCPEMVADDELAAADGGQFSLSF